MSSYITIDIIIEILSKLDVQNLLCCRSVSKEWRSLIDSSGFINTHMSQSIKTNKNNTLFINEVGGRLYSLNFDTLDAGNIIVFQDQPFSSRKRQEVFLMGSCNGLLCLSNEHGDVVILNQSTREQKVILSFVRYKFQRVVRMAPDDGWVSGSAYGFGYDKVSNDYKVVRIAKFLAADLTIRESEMTIYSVKKDSSTIIKMPYVILIQNDQMGVYVHGSLHWIARSWFDNCSDTDRIVGFDLGVDKFREVPQPDYGSNVMDIGIGILGGCLCVFVKFRDVGVDVWFMKEYGVMESWSKVFSISSKELCYDLVRPLGYSRRGREVLLELDAKRLVWYDMETKRVVDIVTEGRMKVRIEAVLCLRSLVPPDGNERIVISQQPPEEQKKTDEEEG